MLLSVPWQAAQIRLISASPFSLSLWQTLTLLEILFHHSNVELPADLDYCIPMSSATHRVSW